MTRVGAQLLELPRDLQHVPGRQELALLDVQRGAGPRRRGEQVGLAAEERRDLQHVDRLGHGPALVALVDVGQHRAAEALAHLGQHLDALGEPEPARALGAGAVGLVERALVDQPEPARGADLDQRAARSRAHAPRLSIWHGPAISTKGRSLPRVSGPTSTCRIMALRSPLTLPAQTSRDCVDGGLDERGEQRVRSERLRLQLRVKLHADEPGVVRQLDDLGQAAVGRHAGEAQAGRAQAVDVVDVDLVAVAVALADRGLLVDAMHEAAALEHAGVGAKPHRAAEIAARAALLHARPRAPIR